MSNRAIDAIKDFSKSKGSERLLLFMIADGINKDSAVYRAKISTLMAECNMSERWVHYLIPKLISLGELVLINNPGYQSEFAIPIFEGEQGYDPQPCDDPYHDCTHFHTPISVNRDNYRRDEWNAAKLEHRRTRRKVKGSKGVQPSAPPTEDAQGVQPSAPPGAAECTPRVQPSAPPGAVECTPSTPSLTPSSLPEVSTRAHARTKSPHTEKKPDEETPEPDAPSPLPPSPALAESAEPLEPGSIPPERLWAIVVSELKRTETLAAIASWILPAHIQQYGWDADGVLRVILHTVGRAHADMLEQRYGYLICGAISRQYHISASHVWLSYNHAPHTPVTPAYARRATREVAP